jgi:hypothetical protein
VSGSRHSLLEKNGIGQTKPDNYIIEILAIQAGDAIVTYNNLTIITKESKYCGHTFVQIINYGSHNISDFRKNSL